ncbi:MAG: hypothetical protein K6T70_02175 [Meiothermus ruber]|uniref:hypothetical protein n=1 Tax=Meiothermus ruber TaxID=277 RepID=UPI0023F86092|nr:hypothetical protein [Meiothermus ruber]MCL6528910.1 hypothetical protein [Meiothermus ruber]
MLPKKIPVPARSLIIRELTPPPPMIHVRQEPHEMFWQILDRHGRVVREADSPIHNLVLNQARDTLVAQYGFTPQSRYAVVGQASGAPQPTDTGMTVERARTDFVPDGESDTVTRVSPGVYNVRRVRQFTAAQVGNQNLTHWGFSGSATPGNNLMCLEQFKDGSGNPITLTPDADQQLRLIYISRITVGPVVATPGSINIVNIGTRTGKFIALGDGSIYGGNFPASDIGMLDKIASGGAYGYSGNATNWGFWVRPNTFTPNYNTNTGEQNTGFLKTPSIAAYVPGSKQRFIEELTFIANEANFTIRAMGLAWQHLSANRAFAFGFVFDPGQEFAKDNLHELRLTGWGVSWT